ncbi:MAG: hypothetical protein KME42_26245 [Tildeniella nuda ZEHNDER 1965/U140]|nr:hypothetical protein [Tildeniella nuda ZEHNDER 1965/U140]
MYSFLSSRAHLPRSLANALSSESLHPRPFSLCDGVFHDRYRILKPLTERGNSSTIAKAFILTSNPLISFVVEAAALNLKCIS